MKNDIDYMKEEKSNIRIEEEEGIIYVTVPKIITEEKIWNLVEEIKEALVRNPDNRKILIEMKTVSPVRSSEFRKITADKIRAINEVGLFSKTALFGSNILIRTIATFIIAASRAKNIKLFKTKEEALKWLKEQ